MSPGVLRSLEARDAAMVHVVIVRESDQDQKLSRAPAPRRIGHPAPADCTCRKNFTISRKLAKTSLHGCQGSMRALLHDDAGLRVARHGAALVEAQPGVAGIGIAR